jgi:hypothetical protein
MGLSHSPKIVTDGLVFAMDSGNDKSFKGPPIQNITAVNTTTTYSASGISFTGGTETVFVPSIGTIISQVTTGYNNYPAVSTGCCPNLYTYFTAGRIAAAASTLYTYGLLYKTTSGYTHPNFMYRYEYNSAGTYLTEAGIFSTTNRIDLGDGWYWAWNTFTTQATTATIAPYSFYYKYGTDIDKFYVARVLIVQGNYTGLNPRYWPDVNTTRSNTNVLSNLMNINSITSNNLVYASDGAFTFNGTSSFLSTSQSYTPTETADYTISAWFKTSTASGRKIIGIENDQTGIGAGNYDKMLYMGTNGKIHFGHYNNLTNIIESTNTLNDGTWHNAVGVYNDTKMELFIDGISNGTLNVTDSTMNVNGWWRIGSYKLAGWTNGGDGYFTGDISIACVYHRGLNAAEVQQNFNALRGRFGR